MAQFNSQESSTAREASADNDGQARIDYVELLLPVARHWRSLVSVIVVAGVLGTAYAFTLTPIFTARALFIPPQQQGGASNALAQLGALAGMAGIGGPSKSSADEYVAMLQSVTVGDRMVDKFNLMTVYNAQFRDKARDVLGKSSSFAIGKKDGLITVAVDDPDPKRAAAMANQYIEELRRLTAGLAVSEAQRRRLFFEEKLRETRDNLTTAQIALQGSGFTEGALKAEPRALAEGYAKLQADLTASLVALETMRQSLADTSADVLRQQAKVAALREQLQVIAKSDKGNGGPSDFVSKYREFKYQETLFDLMAKQYELARVDEAREGAIIQVVDPALPPEHKSRPARLQFGLATAVVVGLLYGLILVMRGRFRANLADPVRAQRWAAMRAAMRRRG